MNYSIAYTVFLATQLAGCSAVLDSRLTELDARSIEVVTEGTGPATVVFEAGLGDDWTRWDQVAAEVALHARVFAYSRPGYGRSQATVAARDPHQIVAELRQLLRAEHLSPPYLLVGHSTGGGYMELFAKAHPEEIIGVVLVDPRHRDFMTACTDAGIEGCGIPESALPGMPAVQRDEYRGYSAASLAIEAAGPFGDYPVRVLTATDHPVSPEWESLWQSMLGSLAAEAPRGEQVMFEGAGHYLQLDRSHEVAESIIGLLPLTD